MKPILTAVFAGLFALPLTAQEAADTIATVPGPSIFIDGTDVELKQFLWKNRPLIVFADSPDDPRFVQQMELLTKRADELAQRDVVVLTDTDPDARGPLRQRLHPRGFMLVLMVKDGTIYLRKPLPWDVREISRTIDKLPMRQQEIRERRAAPGADKTTGPS
ncbi:hypothetical protein DC366_02975 [Pelagivirga sediminicola]|uniref:DUF4174 domain-containing protein n=1 Tax=Pelagivirga sediminicola TaxID=2170575 RepID=A0A2T7GBX0_9RHOB|nr:DUF4174 domain-containing protein [Pelagivirga sediminicola]PVA11906.1 hypothetical protein DC366_02975 [Pelagivirga sediminicola]